MPPWRSKASSSPRSGSTAITRSASSPAIRQDCSPETALPIGGGWKVNAELPGPHAFAAASQFVRPEDVAASIPCGNDVDAFVEAVRAYADAGFTEIALVQVGGDAQGPFLDWAEKELLPALREL